MILFVSVVFTTCFCCLRVAKQKKQPLQVWSTVLPYCIITEPLTWMSVFYFTLSHTFLLNTSRLTELLTVAKVEQTPQWIRQYRSSRVSGRANLVYRGDQPRITWFALITVFVALDWSWDLQDFTQSLRFPHGVWKQNSNQAKDCSEIA